VVGHGLVKAALFLCVGIVLHRLRSVNETWLHGRGRHLRVTGVVFTLAAFGLADLPPFATFLGKGYIDESAWAHGLPWVLGVFLVCAVLTGGAVFRVAGGVFYGLGDPPSEDPQMAQMAAEETGETDSDRQRTPLTMIVPPVLLVACAAVIGLITRLGPAVQAAAVRFQDQAGYNATVLAGAHVVHPVAPTAAESTGITLSDVLTGTGSVAGALVLAFLALYWRRLPVLRRGYEPGAGLTRPIQRFQSGVLNDYVTWIVLGLACLGGALTLLIR
jgi:multicomponent Na+:H+ antiporter subunit D